MKKYVYLLSLFFFTVTTNGQIVWETTGLSVICPSITISNSGVIYAGTTTGDVYKSIDNAANWTSSNIGAAFNISDIEVAPNNGYLFLSTAQNGVYRSTNDGLSWQQLAMTAGLETRDIEIKSGTIFVSTKDNGLGKSTDNGDTWTGASSSVPESNVGAFTITNNGTLLLGVKGSNGLYRSTDDGASWTLTNFPMNYRVYSLTVASNSIFAGTGEYLDGIYKSIDDGATWQKLVNTSNYEYKSNGIYTSDGKILIGVLGSGIYGSTDLGNTWQFYNDGLQSFYGFVLVQAPNGTIYATSGDGVFKSTGTTDIGNDGTVLNNFRLEQNFPNPFNPSTSIQYAIGSTHFVSLKVYDVLGNEIATLVNEEQNAGIYSINFDAAQISSGVYFYRLNTDKFSETKSMILIK